MNTIIKPVITEKTLKNAHTENKYTFEVLDSANKIEVAKEVEKKFNVKVLGVTIMRTIGKKMAWGKKRIQGRKSQVKKAIVTLKPGNNISDFDIK